MPCEKVSKPKQFERDRARARIRWSVCRAFPIKLSHGQFSSTALRNLFPLYLDICPL